jgi:hypothetical protein
MCYAELCDLGCKRVGLKSFVISIDYWDYMSSSSKFECFGACFCTCALIIWSVLLQLVSEQNGILNTSYEYLKIEVLFVKSVKNLKFISISMPVITSLSPNKDS